jgi:hypothetical protein
MADSVLRRRRWRGGGSRHGVGRTERGQWRRLEKTADGLAGSWTISRFGADVGIGRIGGAGRGESGRGWTPFSRPPIVLRPRY